MYVSGRVQIHRRMTCAWRRVHYKLQSGAYGFTMLEDKDYADRDRQQQKGSEGGADDSSR